MVSCPCNLFIFIALVCTSLAGRFNTLGYSVQEYSAVNNVTTQAAEFTKKTSQIAELKLLRFTANV